MAAFSTQLRYRFGDIDEAGIAYYPTLFHYFHCAFEDWWADGIGVSYPKLLQEVKLGFPVVKVEADFQGPVVYGHDPQIHVGVLRFGERSVTFGFWMVCGGSVRNRAQITTVSVDMATMQPVPLDASWRAKMEPFLIAPEEFPPGR